MCTHVYMPETQQQQVTTVFDAQSLTETINNGRKLFDYCSLETRSRTVFYGDLKRVARNTPSFCTELMGPPTPVQNGTHVQTTTYDDTTAWTHLQNRFFTVRQALLLQSH
jgi:hypothetical protein